MGLYSRCGRIVLSANLVFLAACSDDVSFDVADQGLESTRSGMPMTEKFTQGTINNKLDVLFVVDNSASMAEEQEKLGSRINTFLGTLGEVDWQLAITTTDVSNGKYGLQGKMLTFAGTNSHILTKKTPNYMQAFENTIVRAETIGCNLDCPSSNEQPIKAAMMAIDKRNVENAGFFREGADIGLLILSDEDEMSSGGSSATKPQELLNHVEIAFEGEKNLYSYGMVIKPGDSSCMSRQNGGGNYGNFVNSLAMLTGGLVGSICEEDYAPTLGLISEHARRLMEFVELKKRPAGAEVKVTFSPAHTTTWRVDRKRIYFAQPPPRGTTIQVDYIIE